MLAAIARYHDHIYDTAYDAFASGTPTTKRIYDWFWHCWRVVDVIDVGRAARPMDAVDPDALIKSERVAKMKDSQIKTIALVDRCLAAHYPAAISLTNLAKESGVNPRTLSGLIERHPDLYETRIERIKHGNLPSKRMMIRMLPEVTA